MVYLFRLFLVVNLLLGNDILVKLETSKDSLSMVNLQEENILMKASVVTNPFCKAMCNFKFVDLSNNVTVLNEDFAVRPTNPYDRDIPLKAPALGSGIILYRLEMECRSISEGFCETSKEANEKIKLITVQYSLNEEQAKLKSVLHAALESSANNLTVLHNQEAQLRSILTQLDATFKVDDDLSWITGINGRLERASNNLTAMKAMWDNQEFSSLQPKSDALFRSLQNLSREAQSLNQSVFQKVADMQTLNTSIELLRGNLLYLDEARNALAGFAIVGDINTTFGNFDVLLETLARKPRLPEVSITAARLFSQSEDILQAMRNSEPIGIQLLLEQVKIDLNKRVLCNVSGQCAALPSTNDRALQNVTVEDLCGATNDLLALYQNTSALLSIGNTQNASLSLLLLNSLKGELAKEMVQEISINNSRSQAIKDLLYGYPNKANASFMNSSLAIFETLGKELPEPCDKGRIKSVMIVTLNTSLVPTVYPFMALDEPAQKCCIRGSCQWCCDSEDCRKNDSLLPVLLIHGHSFNLDLSADYSPEIFNKLQEDLEKDGFLNAGVLSIYNQEEIDEGILGKFGQPITLKVSYYVDLYKQPDSFVLVQIKNENLDTYAIRLKELIDNVKVRTGKDKVKVIAHSMGGLVVRRYMQIFGEDNIERIIFMGSPHHGIAESVYNLCRVKGSKLACRDMKNDSLLLNKLNRDPLPSIPITNIVGTGCLVNGDDGDGIVAGKSATLQEAKNIKNIMINGSCGRLAYFHTEMLDIARYPDVHSIIKKELTQK